MHVNDMEKLANNFYEFLKTNWYFKKSPHFDPEVDWLIKVRGKYQVHNNFRILSFFALGNWQVFSCDCELGVFSRSSLNCRLKNVWSLLTNVNACKNILVVISMMERPLCATVLCALYLEWGNPICYVLVLYALIGDCSFRSIKNNPQGGDKKDEEY